MRLKKIIIKGFKSIKEEKPLILDEKITILIGANDHGKTNILSAIQCLNDDIQIKPVDKNWDLDDTAPVSIKWYFSISDEMLPRLNELAAIQENSSAAAAIPPQEFFAMNDFNEIVYYRDNISKKVKVESVPIRVSVSKENEILKFRPRIELFESPSSNLIDQVNLAQLNDPPYEFMQGIFRLAGIWDNRKEMFVQNDRTSKLLDAASKQLTKTFNDKWNQGKDLKWKLEHTGTNGDNIVIKIEDPSIQSQYTRPSARSSGFRTYFLLSMITFARIQSKQSDSYVFLFDEPGTYLHPQAQLDLQKSFETIADRTQIIYTTHSLFLINKNYPIRNRVISKTKNGTQIDQKPFLKNWKSVRDSLGILLSNNFLIADKTLLVEGPSDIIYILCAIKKYKKTQDVDIDLNDFSIIDAGNKENYVAMAKLMLSEGRDIVALIDGDKNGENIKNQLEKSCEAELKLKIISLSKNKSSEDIFCNIEALKKAIKTVSNNLINDKIRILKKDIDFEKRLKTIKSGNETLGYIIDKTTQSFFEPDEKLSKLSIALEYENIIQDNEFVLPNEALIELKKIAKCLGLRGEKSFESGVFEEVK